MAPAIKLARDGFVLTRGDTDIIDAGAAAFCSTTRKPRQIFLHAGRLAPAARRPAGAERSRRHAGGHRRRAGRTRSTRAPTPQRLAAAMTANGGLITAPDLAAYTRDRERPVHLHLSRLSIALCAAALVRRHHALRDPEHPGGLRSARPWASTRPRPCTPMVEAMRHAYVDRNSYLGDPAFVKNPLERLLSQGLRGADPRQRSGRTRRPRRRTCSPATAAAREDRRRRIIRWSTRPAMPSP